MDVDVATRMAIRNVTATDFVAATIADRIGKRDIVNWDIVDPEDGSRPKVVLTKVDGSHVVFHGGVYAIR